MEDGVCKDETYAKKINLYVAYWENILELLSNPLPLQIQLSLKVFGLPTIGGLITCKVPYCGPKNMQPSLKTTIYTPFPDLGLCDFILVRHVDLKLYRVWMGRAKNEVVKDEQVENFKHLHIQWWLLVKKGARNDR